MLDGKTLAIKSASIASQMILLETYANYVGEEHFVRREFDREDVEGWLERDYDWLQTRTIGTEPKPVDCRDGHDDCDCRYCYEVRHVDPRSGLTARSFHFTNNDVCRCKEKGCCSAQ